MGLPNRINNRRRVRRVLEFLDTNAMDRLSLEAAAKVAALSKFHFLRVYSEHVGETLGETRARLRLTKARSLLSSGLSVAEVAFHASYGSPQALAYAFRRYFGLSPGRIRSGSSLPVLPPRIEWMETRRVASVAYQGKITEVHASFDRLVVACQKAMVISGQPSLTMVIRGESFGEDGRELDIQCTMAVSRVPPSLDEYSIPGGPYLAFRTISPLPALPGGADWYFDIVRKRSRLKQNREFILCRPLRDPCLTPPRERAWDLLVPLRTP